MSKRVNKNIGNIVNDCKILKVDTVNKNTTTYYIVECSRGHIMSRHMSNVKKYKCPECKKEDEIKSNIGLKVGLLTCVRFHGKREDIKSNSNFYEFECECGNKFLSVISTIKSGVQKSCGCIKKSQEFSLKMKEIGSRRKSSNEFILHEDYCEVICSNGSFQIDLSSVDF